MTKRFRPAEWDKLRALGTSRLVQLSVLIPLIGYAIIFSAELQSHYELFIGSPSKGGGLWRLYFMYFGFCCLAFGSLMFAAFCPDEIKAHGAAWEFVDREAETMGEQRLSAIRRSNLKVTFLNFLKVNEMNEKLVENFMGPKPEVGPDHLNIWQHFKRIEENIDDMRPRDVLVEYFVRMKSTRRVARYATFLAYLLGFSILAIPALNVFYLVALTTI